ncbi:MAG TPA: hypothetical protein VK993_12060 [Chthoniobacterales bacterium]|nr:hypothetical protein [Chthoniobacterales bacterium]
MTDAKMRTCGLMRKHLLRLTTASLLALAPTTVRAAEPPHPQASPTPEPPITVSGEILGITIGMPMKEARDRLKPLREKVAGALDQKEKLGQRTYWKLVGTEYDWVMAWANREGKITKIRAVLRQDQLKPFDQIGDVAKAVSSGPTTAVWDVFRESGSFRLTALGADGRAVRISMLAFDPNLPDPQDTDESE